MSSTSAPAIYRLIGTDDGISALLEQGANVETALPLDRIPAIHNQVKRTDPSGWSTSDVLPLGAQHAPDKTRTYRFIFDQITKVKGEVETTDKGPRSQEDLSLTTCFEIKDIELPGDLYPPTDDTELSCKLSASIKSLLDSTPFGKMKVFSLEVSEPQPNSFPSLFSANVPCTIDIWVKDAKSGKDPIAIATKQDVTVKFEFTKGWGWPPTRRD